MTGPEHYELAEQMLEQANDRNAPVGHMTLYALEALAHATLANAAANVWGNDGQMAYRAEWYRVAGIQLPEEPDERA